MLLSEAGHIQGVEGLAAGRLLSRAGEEGSADGLGAAQAGGPLIIGEERSSDTSGERLTKHGAGNLFSPGSSRILG